MRYIDELYGEVSLTGIIAELVMTHPFQRLKRVHQGGAIFLSNPSINHTRFEHSIGVMALVNKLGGSLEEQIAGLLHDISHTAFSHLIDYVLEVADEDYHEHRYETVLKSLAISQVLHRSGFDVSDFLHVEQFKLLEYPLPNLSADRIDYTLRDLHKIHQVAADEVKWFLGGLQVYEQRIVLKEKAYGDWFQSKYAYLVDAYFGGEENIRVNAMMKEMVQSLWDQGIIEECDFFEDDFYLLKKMGGIDVVRNKINTEKWQGATLKTKQRIVDPEILVGKRVVRLSEIQ